MATSRNLDKGGLVFRINYQTLGKEYGCPGVEQTYNSITIVDNGGSTLWESALTPIFTRESNNIELKIPTSWIEQYSEDLTEGWIYLSGSQACDPQITLHFSLDPKETSSVNLAKGGWYYINVI